MPRLPKKQNITFVKELPAMKEKIKKLESELEIAEKMAELEFQVQIEVAPN